MANPLWVEKYRPHRLADVVLPAGLKADFEAMIASGSIPNLLLSGPAGIGKTTVAKALADEMGYDVFVINGSLNGNIDTLRNEIMDFASSVSFTGARKLVILDEADYLNAQSTQPALRNFMEEFSGNCGFILTCNYKARIIPALQSRCSVVEFGFKKSDVAGMAGGFFKRVTEILKEEGVEFQPDVVGALIKRYFPDWRRILNELQRYAASGKIDNGILARAGDADFAVLLQAMKSKDFTSVRRWVGENSDSDSTVFFRRFYDQANDILTSDSVPQLILAIGEYQYKAAHVADQEINMAAFLVYVMASCQFK